MSEINIVGKIGNFYSIKANKSDLTIGLYMKVHQAHHGNQVHMKNY